MEITSSCSSLPPRSSIGKVGRIAVFITQTGLLARMKQTATIILFVLVASTILGSIFGISLTTHVHAQTPFKVATVGDMGCTPNTIAVTSAINKTSPDRVLGLGDYSYQTMPDCWENIIAQYPLVHDRLKVALGNHEDDACIDCPVGTNLNSTGRAIFLANHGMPPTFYSFTENRVMFLVLDSETDSQVQLDFANTTLTSALNDELAGIIDWKIVYFHHPVYSSKMDTPDANNTAFRTVYQPLFDEKGVDLVLQGHKHAYERQHPLKYNAIITHEDTRDYVNPQGQIYITAGTGGKSLDLYTSKPQMSIVQVSNYYGFLYLEIDGKKLDGKFLDTFNMPHDSFTVVKTYAGSSVVPPSPPNPPPSNNYSLDIWAKSQNTADYVNNYQLKLGEQVNDANRRNATLLNSTMYLYRAMGSMPTGTLSVDLVDSSTNTVLATSTNVMNRTSVTAGAYLPYAFLFSGAHTPAGSSFIVALKCSNCNAEKTVLGATKISNPYPNGNEMVFRSGAWSAREPDAFGFVWYQK